ncbi:MAG TPA: hypothetical protein VFW84_08545 [Aquabacterium sp.]|uniref:hypothetical protein n=1 Tax=Aquabacterium sp. TaxID=1872578 RepID=UPI002E2F0238|nr:hypothetical protein [Aquabacterium sp.]HEX5372770.1 hypothetical protein [Aquabacterium sp.]
MLHLAFLCCVAFAHAGEGGASAAAKASGPADKKFNFDDYSTWPRSISALKKLKEVSDEQSGYKLFAGRALYGEQDQDRKCQYYLNILTSSALKEEEPVYSTDDDQAATLKKYRKQCPIYSKNGEHARDDDYLLQYIGSFNYKIFKLKRKSGAVVDLICADVNPLLSEADGFVRCALPDVRRCDFVKYGRVGNCADPVLVIENSMLGPRHEPNPDYPYGMSVVYVGDGYYGLSVARRLVSDASGFYAFGFKSLNPSDRTWCHWSFSTDN